ncbi:hypothetical protein BT69DRAFT_1281795 [Atractiella rhizophila]|nr:hypothetical protein BT69DRAFT_1281795 [Atractiella rhizophila]
MNKSNKSRARVTLPRNEACNVCRKRKVRCDGGTPCGPCSRLAAPDECAYNAQRGKKPAYVRGKEKTIAGAADEDCMSEDDLEEDEEICRILEERLEDLQQELNVAKFHVSQPMTTEFSASDLEQVLPPAPRHFSWPSDLPTPEITIVLVKKAFSATPYLHSILSLTNLLIALSHGSEAHHFPSTALLHSICLHGAFAMSHTDLLALRGGKMYWDTIPTEKNLIARSTVEWFEFFFDEVGGGERERRCGEEMRKQFVYEWHLRHLRKRIFSNLENLSKTEALDLTKAALVCLFFLHMDERWALVELFGGIGMRLAVMIGLHQQPPLARSEEERQEQYYSSSTFWLLFATETYCRAITCWASCLSQEDITCPLPWLHRSLPASSILARESRFLQDENPFRGLQSEHVFYKSFWLASSLAEFVTRTNWEVRELGPSSYHALRSSPKFLWLDSTIRKAIASFPNDFPSLCSLSPRDLVGSDLMRLAYLFPAYTILCGSLIFLHAPFFSFSPTSTAMRTCYDAALNVFAVLELFKDNIDGNRHALNVYSLWGIALSLRTLIREWAVRREREKFGMLAGAPGETARIEGMCRRSVTMLRKCTRDWKAAATITIPLLNLLVDPASCLPSKERWGDFEMYEDHNCTLSTLVPPQQLHVEMGHFAHAEQVAAFQV